MISFKENFLPLFFVVILFFSLSPFYIWKYQTLTYYVVAVGFVLWGLWKRPEGMNTWSFMLLCVFYTYATLYQYRANFNGMVMTFLPLMIFLIDTARWPKIFKNFSFFFSVTLIPSLIVYFLVYWIGVSLPFSIINPLNELKEYQYFTYPFLVAADDPVQGIRFCGYYDEPGVIGTVSGVLLIINRFDFRDWKNYPLFISGIFSFSLFFYALIVGYVFLWGTKKMKFIVAFVVVLFSSFILSSDNPFVELIYDRVSDDEFGDNRTLPMFVSFWDKFCDSELFWVGCGRNYANMVADPGGASYKHMIVDHGIIMSSIFAFAFLLRYISLKLSRRNLLLMLFIFITVIYQRPYIFSLFYLFLLLAPASVLEIRQIDDNSIDCRSTNEDMCSGVL